jgi:hypothetical protein
MHGVLPRRFDNFDPVPYRCAASAVEVELAADIGGGDDRRFSAFQRARRLSRSLRDSSGWVSE